MLRASMVIDYQNVHLTARDTFEPNLDKSELHKALIHPMQFARRAIQERNASQRPDFPSAELLRVFAFRGLPGAEHDIDQHLRCITQAQRWRHDGAFVELRDLKYRYKHGADQQPIKDIYGKKIPIGAGREKGIDVLCALRCINEALQPDVDLVMLASRDTDLQPVLDEIYDLHGSDPGRFARVETVSWHNRNFRIEGGRTFGYLQPTPPRRTWNTNLDRSCYEASLDRTDYS